MHRTLSRRKLLLFLGDVVVAWFFLSLAGHFLAIGYFSIFKEDARYIAVLAGYILLFYSIFELYDLAVASRGAESFKRILISNLFIWGFYLFTPYITPSIPERRFTMVLFLSILWIGALVWRGIYIKLMIKNFFQKRDTLLLSPRSNISQAIKEIGQIRNLYNLVAVFNEDDDERTLSDDILQLHRINQLKQFLSDYKINQIIIYPGIDTAFLKEIFSKCIERNIQISSYSSIIEINQERLPVASLNEGFFEDFLYDRYPLNRYYSVLVRFANLVLSSFCIVILIVMLPIILIGNWLGNRGALFYRQERVGEHGRIFRIIKLRSMTQDAEKHGAQFTQKGDLRITPFGKVLRKLRIDELPQVINVLRGEMSFIGPRPEQPVFVKALEKENAVYSVRHVVKPGLTGWAQVKFGYGASIEDNLRKLEYDLYFIKHRGFWLDLRIVIRTIGTILLFKGE